MSGATFIDERIQEELPETLDELVSRLEGFYSKESIATIRKAYDFSEKAHLGQIRRSGEPYISHPLGVSAILADLKLDVATIVTGLLHDTVEDTEVTLEDVEEAFGETVAYLVDGVTKISKMKFKHTHEKQGENIRKMIVAMGKDVRVVLVKLADRLHNMRTLTHMPYEKQRRIAQETLDIYAPLASRLGISSLKIELEDLSFRYAFPDAYYELAQKVEKKKRERERYIEEVKKLLADELLKRTKVKFEVEGRPKHFYSIYRKMAARDVAYDQVYDLLAFRVMVNNVQECYEALGVVHSLWKPIPGRFKDFIAMPKANNYQSLHTTVIGPQAERIEIQIRTQEMHRVAEWGIAAHWKYKEETRGTGGGTGRDDLAKFNWLRELVSMHQQTSSSDEFLENIKSDLLDAEIYVFTPKGDVKEFPDGASPIDFAYSIHTDVGNHIVAARVNGRMVSLKYQLQNGDTVEVITSKNQTPSKDWLKFVVTSRAKAKIRQHVKVEQRRRAAEIGKEILEKAFRKAGYSLQKYLDGAQFEKFTRDHGFNSAEDIYVRVGYGRTTPVDVIKGLVPEYLAEDKAKDSESFLEKAVKSATSRKKATGSLVIVDGMSDVLVRFAKCCNPIPGDSIVGFISRGRGIAIHTADCEKAFEMDQDRKIDVSWSKDRSTSEERIVRVQVVSQDIPGLLKSMTEVFSLHGINILNAQIRTTRDKKAVCLFDVNVKDTEHLSGVMSALQKIKGIMGVSRINHT